MLYKTITVLVCIALSGCTEAEKIPETPQFLAAKDAELLRITQERCGTQAGGFSDARELERTRTATLKRAKDVGATTQDYANARQLWEGRFTAGQLINGLPATCSQLMSASGTVSANL